MHDYHFLDAPKGWRCLLEGEILQQGDMWCKTYNCNHIDLKNYNLIPPSSIGLRFTTHNQYIRQNICTTKGNRICR